MKKILVIRIELELSPQGFIKVNNDRSRFQSFADDMAKHFATTPEVVGTKVDVQIRDK